MEQIEVFCAGAAKAALAAPAAEFEGRRGLKLNCTFGPAGGLKRKALAGERVHMFILSRPTLEELEQAGLVEPGTIFDIGTTGVGVVVRKGRPLPDVSSPAALRQALLGAGSLTYGDPAHGDSSGTHFSWVIEKLGIGPELAGKTVLARLGVEVVEKVAQGSVEMGATQSSIILASADVALAGMLPQGLQRLTTYAAGLATGSSEPAREFGEFLGSAETRAHFERMGFARSLPAADPS
ncbi:molybdate ABC transporter substrate-binding protein [Candidimonas nitroreducens]|uniref:molybdate ABC transporter substrate-binding protein n=1 Tax=Candidimonas nitroreducens TaxID=683354 RepID=UPI001303A7C8|nr:substrate-binding domain-containing protein [Candidimonas nitroreducens]